MAFPWHRLKKILDHIRIVDSEFDSYYPWSRKSPPPMFWKPALVQKNTWNRRLATSVVIIPITPETDGYDTLPIGIFQVPDRVITYMLKKSKEVMPFCRRNTMSVLCISRRRFLFSRSVPFVLFLPRFLLNQPPDRYWLSRKSCAIPCRLKRELFHAPGIAIMTYFKILPRLCHLNPWNNSCACRAATYRRSTTSSRCSRRWKYGRCHHRKQATIEMN